MIGVSTSVSMVRDCESMRSLTVVVESRCCCGGWSWRLGEWVSLGRHMVE
jgi:hypothetical protein